MLAHQNVYNKANMIKLLLRRLKFYKKSQQKLSRQKTLSLQLQGTKDLLKHSKSYQKESCFRVGFCLIDSLDNLKIAHEKKQTKLVDAMLCNTHESFGEDKRHVVLIHDKNTAKPLKDISLDDLCFTLIKSSLAGHLKKSSKMLQ